MRPVSFKDYVEAGIKSIPNVFQNGQSTARETEAQQAERLELGVKFMEMVLTKACGPLTTSEGERFKIVSKELDQLAPDEISTHEVDQADAQMIFSEVLQISRMGQEAAKAAQPFPAE